MCNLKRSPALLLYTVKIAHAQALKSSEVSLPGARNSTNSTGLEP